MKRLVSFFTPFPTPIFILINNPQIFDPCAMFFVALLHLVHLTNSESGTETIDEEPPVIRVLTQSLTYNEGDFIILYCEAGVWVKHSNHLIKVLPYRGRTLLMKNVRVEDSGLYQCADSEKFMITVHPFQQHLQNVMSSSQDKRPRISRAPRKQSVLITCGDGWSLSGVSIVSYTSGKDVFREMVLAMPLGEIRVISKGGVFYNGDKVELEHGQWVNVVNVWVMKLRAGEIVLIFDELRIIWIRGKLQLIFPNTDKFTTCPNENFCRNTADTALFSPSYQCDSLFKSNHIYYS